MFSRLTLTIAAAAAALTLASAPMAQDTQTFEPATLLLTNADGEELQYTVGDASFYVSTIEGYDGQPDTVDFSLSLSTISPINEELLEWSTQTPGKNKAETRSVVIVGTQENGDEIRYEVTDARVTSVSMSQSTYAAPSVSLSLMAGELTINGVAMN